MKRFIITWSILALLFVGTSFAASVRNIELAPLNGGLVAKIAVADGQVRFQHQVEEPKDGKPYRVIVDVLSATHELGQRNFENLPDCPITQIRTSQYSVTPEQIVRIVFDMANAPLYQVTDEEAGFVKVIFTDRSVKPFTAWSSSNNAAPAETKPAPEAKPTAQGQSIGASPQSAAAFNQSSQSDKLASLSTDEANEVPVPVVSTTPTPTRKPTIVAKAQQSKSESTTPATVIAPSQPAVAKPVVVAAKPTVASKPAATGTPDAPVTMPAKPPITPKTNPEAVVASKEADAKSTGSTVKPSAPSQQTLADKITASRPEAEPKESAKPVEPKKTVTAATPPAEKQTPAVKEVAPKPATPAVVAQNDSEEEKRTSRFRRSPTRPSKLQGTMVAEFPKRLVIKYKARNHRDPFATLIDDTKTYDNPIEQRVPNVEGLRLVGIIEAQGGANQALFEDNTGYSYILKSGDKVKKGYVLRVETDRVYFQIFEYGWSRTVALEIEE